MLDTVFGAIEAGVLSEWEHFEQGGGNKNHVKRTYSHTLSEYRKTHERVLLIFKRKNAVLESKEIRDVLEKESRRQEEGGRLEWDLREEKGWLWYCVICEKTEDRAFERKRSILRELITKIKSTRKGESTTSNDDGMRADVDATDEAIEVLN